MVIASCYSLSSPPSLQVGFNSLYQKQMSNPPPPLTARHTHTYKHTHHIVCLYLSINTLNLIRIVINIIIIIFCGITLFYLSSTTISFLLTHSLSLYSIHLCEWLWLMALDFVLCGFLGIVKIGKKKKIVLLYIIAILQHAIVRQCQCFPQRGIQLSKVKTSHPKSGIMRTRWSLVVS